MRKHLVAFLVTFIVATGFSVAQSSDIKHDIDIPYTRFTLPNGLTVVVSEDHKAPIVAVSVWYHVGSAYEPKARPVLRTCSST